VSVGREGDATDPIQAAVQVFDPLAGDGIAKPLKEKPVRW
jgi:hypothetical protein